MNQKNELKLRYEAMKKDLEHRVAQARADASAARNDEAEKLEKKLKELKQAASDSWDNMTEGASKKINDLLDMFDRK